MRYEISQKQMNFYFNFFLVYLYLTRGLKYTNKMQILRNSSTFSKKVSRDAKPGLWKIKSFVVLIYFSYCLPLSFEANLFKSRAPRKKIKYKWNHIKLPTIYLSNTSFLTQIHRVHKWLHTHVLVIEKYICL